MAFFLLLSALLWGSFLHFYAMNFNNILSIPDSFSYLQMASYMSEWKIEALGTGWFGFLYSIPIYLSTFWFQDEIFAAQFANLILINISGILLFLIAKKYINIYYNTLLILIFFLSSSLLHYNIHILSENLFITLFLLLVLLIQTFIDRGIMSFPFFIGLTLWSMYLTRGESFIYIISIFIIYFAILLKQYISWNECYKYIITTFIWFAILAWPYIYYLHTITGEWGLTNKWSSNIRQAMMRGTDTMNDAWFEKAVGELTPDKHHLIAWFAGWLKYDVPVSEGYSFKTLLFKDTKNTINRFLKNQNKLYSETMPKMILWESLSLFLDKESWFYKNPLFFILLLTPILLFIYGLFKLFSNDDALIVLVVIPFFIIGSIFFTLFFVLERYFIIFLPFIFFTIVYWIEKMFEDNDKLSIPKFLLLWGIIWFSYYLWAMYYIDTLDVNKYEVKKFAGIRLQESIKKEGFTVMERFPITTYYSWVKERWLTPYTNDLNDVVEYAKYNKIDYLIVDSLDFKEYRPELSYLLNEKIKYKWLEFIKKIEFAWEMVLIYKFNY